MRLAVIRRVGCLCLALLLAACPAFAAEKLRFDDTGLFRILVVSDVQDVTPIQEADVELIEASLAAARPDLVVLLGDNIFGNFLRFGEEQTRAAIQEMMAPIAEHGAPFALVFGNHDDAGGVSKEYQLKVYQEYENCLAVAGEAAYGCGNYAMAVYGSDDRPRYALYFRDNDGLNDLAPAEGARASADYLALFEKDSRAFAAESGGETVPGLQFVHLPPREFVETLQERAPFTPGAVFDINATRGFWYTVDADLLSAGSMLKRVTPVRADYGEMDALLAGGLEGVVFGHDHANDLRVVWWGMEFLNVPTAGFFSFGDPRTRGTRLITLKESGGYETKMLYARDILKGDVPYFSLLTFGVLATCAYLVGGTILLFAIVFILVRRRRKKRKKKAAAEA